MKTKIIIGSVVLILIIGLAAAAYWWLSRPQVITFSDDAKVTLLKVESANTTRSQPQRLPPNRRPEQPRADAARSTRPSTRL